MKNITVGHRIVTFSGMKVSSSVATLLLSQLKWRLNNIWNSKEAEFYPQKFCGFLQFIFFVWIMRYNLYLLPAFLFKNTYKQIRPIECMTVYWRRKYATQKSKPFFSSWEQRQDSCGILFCSWLCKTNVPFHWMEIRTEALTDGSGS